MLHRVVTVTAPSRLHFGLFAFREGLSTRFGGAGAMIGRPQTKIRIRRAHALQLSVSNARRTREILQMWLEKHPEHSFSDVEQLPLDVREISHPNAHVGLGSGTQATLALASALDRWFDVADLIGATDALDFGRSRRSAVGTCGFFQGGMIVDLGDSSRIGMVERIQRIELPESWRVVLICSRDGRGPSGDEEATLFDSLAPLAPPAADRLRNLLANQLVPAAQAGDFDAFSTAVYEFGFQAGLTFQSVQHGPFNGSQVERVVQTVRSLEVDGVGQSSWGPCVFAFCRSSDEADRLIGELKDRFTVHDYWLEIARIHNQPATVSDCPRGPVTIDDSV